MRRPALTTLLLLLFLSPGAGAASADDQQLAVQRWLDRMALAIEGLTYRGTLVYTRGPRIDAMRILHRSDQSGTRERLVSLTGSPREVLRDNETVRCIFPDSQSVLVDTRIADGLFPQIPPEQVMGPESGYTFSIDGRDRIAQLEAQIINIIPRDQYRYGYRLWLETNSGMLLKSNLLDTNGKPIEQLMFTDIEIGARIPDSELTPDVPESGYVQVDIPREALNSTSASDGLHWKVESLPNGFVLSGHRHSTVEGRTELEHLVFTDGLASVSVYIELDNGGDAALRGGTRMGAVNMYGIKLQGYSVTAVGEVPPATVKRMATSVRATSVAAR